MINSVIDKIIDMTNHHIYISERLYDLLKIDNKYKNDIVIIDDSRSASFSAFGKSKIENKPSILIVDEEEAHSTYTSITEALYQETSLIIVMISKNDFSDFWNFCVTRKIVINDLNDVQNLNKHALDSIYGPFIIRLNIEMNYFYEKIEKHLEKKTNFSKYKDINFFINDFSVEEGDNVKLFNQLYGVLSSFLGYSLYGDGKDILITSKKKLLLDLNILNSRYINPNFKIIVINNDNNKTNVKEWIESNKIEYIQNSKIDDQLITKIMDSKNSVIAMIGDDENVF